MTIYNGDRLEITCKLSFNASIDLINVYHYQMLETSATSDADACDIIATFMADAYSNLAAIMPNNVSAVSVKVVNLTQNKVMGEVPWGAAFSGGTSTSASSPLGVCGLVRLLTTAPGVQGRKFIGTIAQSVISDDGLLEATPIAALALFGADILSTLYIGAGHARLYVLNRITGAINRVWEVAVGAIPAYQRRRKQGIGS